VHSLNFKNLIRDHRCGSKLTKVPYLKIFNKLKYFTTPTFGDTIENPEHGSFGLSTVG